jgi:hypothetical protein
MISPDSNQSRRFELEFLALAALTDEQHHHGERGDAQRHDEQEDPAPVIRLGEVAAERRPDGRPDNHRHAEEALRHRPVLAGESHQQDRLRERYDGRAKDALTHPVGQQRLKRSGSGAQQRGDREADDAGNENRALAHARHQPAGHWRYHRSGHDVQGHHPGDLIGRRRKCALQLRQRYVDDGHRHGVEHGAQCHRHQDQVTPRLGEFLGDGGRFGCHVSGRASPEIQQGPTILVQQGQASRTQ